MNKVELKFSLQKNNLMLARLVAGGISSILDYDIDLASDVKVAVNEACIILFKQNFKEIDIDFCYDDSFVINIKGKGNGAKKSQDDLIFAVSLINELVDYVDYEQENEIIRSISINIGKR